MHRFAAAVAPGPLLEWHGLGRDGAEERPAGGDCRRETANSGGPATSSTKKLLETG